MIDLKYLILSEYFKITLVDVKNKYIIDNSLKYQLVL